MTKTPKGSSNTVCYRKGYEVGPWYEIKTVADVIRMKEARGADTSFERGLLKAWSKEKGYESAAETLKQLGEKQPRTQISKSSDKTSGGNRKLCPNGNKVQDSPITIASNPVQTAFVFTTGSSTTLTGGNAESAAK